MTALPDARALDDLQPADAAAALAPVFAGAPRFVARVVAGRPFGSWEGLLLAARAIAHEMPEDEQLELLDAHPRLGAPPESVSGLSFLEQGYGREAHDPVDGEVVEGGDRLTRELERLNDAYEARFGFRYCVYVAGRPLAALLPGFESALDGDRRVELHRALDAVIDIAAARIAALRA